MSAKFFHLDENSITPSVAFFVASQMSYMTFGAIWPAAW